MEAKKVKVSNKGNKQKEMGEKQDITEQRLLLMTKL